MAKGKYTWFNGDVIETDQIRISPYTHALHYGTGIFEGIRVYKQHNGGGAVFRLKEHVERFFHSAKIIGFTIPYSHEQLFEACVDIVRKNKFEECYIRPLAYITDGPLGLSMGENPPIDVLILVWEWGRYLGDDGVNKGVRLKTSSYIRPHVNSVMTKGKITGQYVTSVIAKYEANKLGFHEALFLDPEGFLAEGTGENLFMAKKGVIKTTPLTSVLEGITRESIIEHLRQQGHSVLEQRFTRDELLCADEVFLCGTAAEITPVREIDFRSIGEGKPGPIASKLLKDYQAIVRGDTPSYGKNWLTPIK